MSAKIRSSTWLTATGQLNIAMNDLRQQQMVAATSSSGSGTGTGTGLAASVESAPASSTAGASTERVNTKAGAPESTTTTTNTSSEEEQRVSSTSSPAQREQQLNADHEPDHDQGQEQEQQQQQHQQRQEALHRRQHHHQPGHITSTTASPPPQPQPPSTHPLSTSLATSRDDAPGTTGVPASASASSGSTATGAASSAGAGAGGGAPMAATAIDVKGEERDGHKIILKLSKHVAAAPNPNLNESQPGGGDETRRVEPLRIQLPSDGGVAKPQDASDADASSCSSSCAEDEVASSLAQHPRSTPHIVPKLTIRAANEERVGSVVPKLTIKLPENPAASGSNSGSGTGSAAAAMPSKNDAHLSSLSPASASSSSASSSSSSSSSSSLAEMQTVPKLMIKTTLAGSSCISSSSNSEEHPHPHQQQIPKLTIKTSGSGGQEAQQHLHTVIMKHDLSNAQSIPKLTIKTKSIDLTEDDASGKSLEQLQPLPKLTIKNLCSPKHKVRAVLEEKLPTTASKLATPVPTPAPASALITNGMESNSSSQEFCGFSDLDADQALSAADEGRRNSDDMDIDESLSKEHDPQMFHNLAPSNGIAGGGAAGKASKAGKPNPVQLPPAQHNVVEMVDLTSSPSPGSSPAHVTNNFSGRISPAQSRPANLIDCLRMKADGGVGAASSSPNSTILLSQLTAPPKSFATASPKSNSSRYPQLTERLLANGGGAVPSGGAVESVATSEDDAIGAPIEILDTPEGSPHITYMEDEHLDSQVLNNHHPANRKDQQPEDDLQEVDNNNENHLKRTSTAGNESPSSGIPPSKQRRMDNNENDQPVQNCHDPVKKSNASAGETLHSTPAHSHRSRKQKHERILNTEMEDAIFPSAQQPPVALPEQNGTVATYPEHDIGEAKAQDPMDPTNQLSQAPTPASTGKRRGRPKRVQQNQSAIEPANLPNQYTPTDTPQEVKSRRVQLLRKRLAIDMVSQDQLADGASAGAGLGEQNASVEDEPAGVVETPTRRDRQLRASRRTTTTPSQQATPKATRKRQSKANAQASQLPPPPPPMLAQFGGSEAESNNNNSTSMSFALAAQIDLTMCSSSSSTSSGAPGAHQAVSGISGSGSSSMLPPTTILSSSDRLKDVIFQPNDFSSIMATQQLRSPRPSSTSGGSAGGSQPDSHDEDNYNSALDNSGDESLSTMPVLSTPTPTRGRGRGRGSRGGSRGSNNGSSSSNRGGGSGGAGLSSTNSQPRAPRMSRGASAVAKAIAMSRPRCVGGLKHTPDPERLKGLFSPSPQVFEEDTRMSADLSNSMQSMSSLMEPPLTPQKQPDFLNNEESQSSMVSNASLMDSNQGQSVDTIIGSSQKRPKKKKMEICVAEDTDYSASSIAEYDWPPPKGCCPSKNRDTFMIQEQVALYLGITSFKRKYPDLPRRAVDMEERNWLQEKGLVSEKMCDLGITAVWASDILDIMYADFYDKYEEYKEYIRLKHLREIEAKQKALGLTVGASRGLQARDRAMLSASKWNVYFNKTRKEERLACLDLQTFTMNQPQHRTAPLCTRLQRSISNVVRAAAEAENMEAPPTLVTPRIYDQAFQSSDYAYPLTVVPDQFSFAYRVFKPAELRAYPLDTALDKPSTDLEEELQLRISPVPSGEEEEAVSKEPEDATAAKTQAPAPVQVQVPVRRSRRALRQQSSDKTRSASNGSTSSAASVSSASSGNASSSDTDSGDDSDCSSSSTSSCDSLAASSSAGSDDEVGNENGRESSQASRLLNCGVCLRSQHRNARDMPEVFIRCYSCRRRVHPSCIDMPQRMVGRVRNYNWQCSGCKCCIKCRSNQRPGKMLFCEQCDRGYHIYCLGLRTVPDGRWSCERCCVCMRCGATRPEGLSQVASPNGERGKNSPRGKRAKWVHEYRIDHVTKLREHAAMFCAPCARTKSASAQAAAQAASESSLPASRDSSPAPVSVPDPSPSPTLNGGPDLFPGEAPSPKVAAVSASPPVVLEVVPTSMSPLSPAVATINRRQLGTTPVSISAMQCSSSLNRNGSEESGASTATTTTTATATISATTQTVAAAAAAAPGSSSASSGGASPAASTTPIGIAPPPVVA
ncbi:uncharacterized protein Dana_GF20276, isoform A [Drosophila ananassae]|uniref:Uncharacterized protein, isoform A n=1 Tax=Drosophila ananassae TaxID=7217 RepID=B3MQB4_DROAN|nr:uncharacterized protein Dana_GF20276, isoform A [Drosophila ananassae]